VLVAEIVAGNTKCGCLGSFSPPPGIMLAIDGALLLGVLLLRARGEGDWLPRPRLLAAAAATVIGAAVSAAVILPENRATEQVEGTAPAEGAAVTGGGPAATDGAGATATPAPSGRTLPPYFALQDPQSWLGQPFAATPLAALVQGWPADLDQGPRYVILFSRSCDHCQVLLESHFAGPPAVPTTLVAIPEAKLGFKPESWLDMAYCADCVGQLELPNGVDWLITPPVVIALADGRVQCVKEADDAEAPECLVFG
jgi:hypothetical protein